MNTTGNHRWLRLSLRTLLVLLTIGCVWLGLFANQVRQQRQVIHWITNLGGAVVYYDYQLDERCMPVRSVKPPAPIWLCEMVGVDCFANVAHVNISSDQLTDVTPLTKLTNLRVLELKSPHAVDVTPLTELRTLEWLLVDVNVNGQDFRMLKEALPRCRVVRGIRDLSNGEG